MTDSLALLLSTLTGGLLGSIPFSLMVARWCGGVDLRQHGSGNVGATNVARTLGWKWGLIALLLDACKGALPVLLVTGLLHPGPAVATHARVLAGVAAVLGHMFSPWLKFKGGKGVATGLGVAAVLSPWATLAALATFALTFALWRIVSLSSIIAALAFAATQLIRFGGGLWGTETWSLGAFSIGVPLLIILRHQSNIGRLWRGEEKRFTLGKERPADLPPSAPAG